MIPEEKVLQITFVIAFLLLTFTYFVEVKGSNLFLRLTLKKTSNLKSSLEEHSTRSA